MDNVQKVNYCSNMVFILRLVGHCGVWVFLPPCDLTLVFFLFGCILHYDLWVCDISVFLLVPVGLTLLGRVMCL
jgi:hypothetical protein